MKSVLMMATANIRKRKAQSFLIMLTILMAALLLATAIGILANISDPFEKMFADQKGSHLTMQLAGDLHVPEQIAQWWQSQAGVEGVQYFPYYMVSGKIGYKNALQSMGDIMISEHPRGPMSQDILVIVDGEAKDTPGINEIWVPTSFAYSWGIVPGDTMDLPINGSPQTMTVSAIVVDPQFSMGMMNPIRAWVADGTLQVLPDSQDIGAIVAVRLSDYSLQDALWTDFEEFLGTPFLGFLYDYEFIGYSYSMVENIVGSIMLLFSSVIILVSVFVIYFTISGAIITDYKLIGILKSHGFSASQVKRVYGLQYLALAVLAVPLGIILSSSVTGAVLAGMTKSLGLAQLNPSLLLPALLTAPIMLAVVLTAALISAAKAGRIKPAEAIRNSAPTSKGSNKRSFNLTTSKSLPISLLLGLKNTLTGKRHSLFMVASAAIMAFVLVFSINAYNSIRNMEQNLAYWGFDNSDVFISQDAALSPDSHNQVLAILNTDERVRAAVPHNVLLTAIAAQAGQSSQNVVGFTYNGDMDSIGMLNLRGNHPNRANEVSLSVLTANKYNKTVGDMVEIYIEGQKGSYLVTGIYQSLNGGGWGFRIQESAVQAVSPDFLGSTYSVRLKTAADPAQFVEDMKLTLGQSYNIRTVADSGDFNFSGIVQSMAMVAVVLSVIFMAVAFIITFNSTLMSIYSDRKSFGIYKALGMTPLQIRMSLVWKVSMLAVVGISAGVPLSLIISPRALGALLTNLGMVRFPFDVTLWGTLAAIPICLLVAVLSAWLPSGRILSLNPRNLIVE